jgi:sugar lactone lactonase YvrE
VADTGNETIRKIDLATGTVTTLAGAQGQSGNADGPAALARFHQPQGLAFDQAAQILYVADAVNRSIRRLDVHAGVVTTPSWVATGSFHSLDAPSGLALDGGHLYAADSTGNVVVGFELGTRQASTVAGTWGVAGAADGVGTAASFYRPTGIAADGKGSLFVTDSWGCTLRRIDIATSTVSTLAGTSQTCSTSDGVGAHATFYLPFGVAANDLGDLFVSDTHNNTVRRVDTSSAVVTTPIGTIRAFGVKLGPLPGQLSQPSAVCLTNSGGLLIVSENAVLLAR